MASKPLPRFIVRNMKGGHFGCSWQDSYIVAQVDEVDLKNFYEKARDRFKTGELQVFVEKPVVLEELLVVKEKA